MPIDRFPRWANVRVTLADGTTRVGHVLVDHGARVLVEYQSRVGRFQCRSLPRFALELLPTDPCDMPGCRDALGHVGDHSMGSEPAAPRHAYRTPSSLSRIYR
jgi:hypothetical protein